MTGIGEPIASHSNSTLEPRATVMNRKGGWLIFTHSMGWVYPILAAGSGSISLVSISASVSLLATATFRKMAASNTDNFIWK